MNLTVTQAKKTKTELTFSLYFYVNVRIAT